jgi:hypothetical protein
MILTGDSMILPGDFAIAEFNGVKQSDIDWSHPLHVTEYCDACGGDGAEGHMSSCEYLYDTPDSPRRLHFLELKIEEALERELMLYGEELTNKKRVALQTPYEFRYDYWNGKEEYPQDKIDKAREKWQRRRFTF